MKTLKWFLLLYAFGTLKAQLPLGVVDSTFYILPNGLQNKYYYQRDVAVFRYNGGAQYTGTLPSFVTSIEWRSDEWHGYNIITFDTSASGAVCQAYAVYLAGDPLFEYGFLPVTKDKDAHADAKKWCMLSDLINVKFANTPVSNTDLNAFETRNNLKLYHRPDPALSNADEWTWVFQLEDNARFLPLKSCADIYTNENGFITVCEPDLHLNKSHSIPSCGNLPTEFAAWNNTSFKNALWHIHNNGGVVNPGSGFGSGALTADAHICDCWGAGLDGTGIKIVCLDYADTYDYSHPNLINQFLPGYNFNTNQFINGTVNNGANSNTHGMEVASVIVGIPDGGQTSSQLHNTTGVGVAFGAKVIPYISDLGNVQIALALQRAVTDGASIVNMSFGAVNATFPQTPFYQDIQLAVQTGRGGLGLIFVASVGNDNGDEITWPAAMEEVIGVGASDPNDFRGSYQAIDGPWDWTNISGGGSNFHDLDSIHPNLRYDVMAPGTCIKTDFTDFSINPPNQSGIIISGTSLAAPVVSGIAAMLLQQNPLMTYNDMINTIDQNTDKPNNYWGVGSSLQYDYNQYSFLPGYDKQMFWGRINCQKAITNPVVGIKENLNKRDDVKLAYINNYEAMFIFSGDLNKSGIEFDVIDIAGRKISSQKIEPNKNHYSFNTDNLVNGVYLFKVVNIDNKSVHTFKYIK